MQRKINNILANHISLYIYHLLVTVAAYIYYLRGLASDVSLYWFQTPNAHRFIDQGVIPLREYFILYMNYPLVQVLHLPIEFGFLLYSSIGFLGILYWKKLTTYFIPSGIYVSGINWLLLVFYLPNVHFFTSLIGKEPLVFLAIAGMLYSMLVSKKWCIFGGCALLLAVVRPYMLAILLAAVLPYCLWIYRKNLKAILTIVLGSILSATLAVWLLIKSSWLQVFDWSRIQQLQEAHIAVFSGTSAYVPIHEYWFPMQWFTFHFRPLPGEYSAPFSIFVALENMISLLICLFALMVCVKNRKKKLPWNAGFSIFILLSLLSVALMAQLYANFGIITRMKIMFQPFFIIVPLYYLALHFANNKR